MTRDEQVNEIIYNMELLRQQLEELEEQEEALNLAYQDLLTSLSFIRDLDKITEKNLIPIGRGIYVEAEIKNKGKFYVDIGSGVIKKSDAEEAKKILEDRVKDIQNSLERISTTEEDIKNRYSQLELALEKRKK